MRSFLNLGKNLLFLLLFIALALSVPCPGGATETKSSLAEENTDSLLVSLSDSEERKVGNEYIKEYKSKPYMPLTDSQIENIPVTNIRLDSVLRSSGETQATMSVTSTTYGETAGLLDCPVPTPSIDNANSGRSQYVSNPSSVKWAVRMSDLNDGKYTYAWREGILILPDGDIVCTGQDNDNQIIFRIHPDGTLNWKTIIGSDGTNYGNLAIDANNKIYLGTYEHMACVDAATGNLDWTYVAPAGPPDYSYPYRKVWSGPVIHPLTGDIIFNTWELVSLDSSGSRNWGNDNDYYYNEHGIAISPYNNYIYSLTYGRSSLGIDSNIYAFDINGNKIYSYNLTDNFPGVTFCEKHAPTITSDGTILCGSSGNVIAAFNPDLTLKWSTAIYPDYNTRGICMLTNGSLSPDESIWYCPDWFGNLYAIDVSDGSVLWDLNAREYLRTYKNNPSLYIYSECGLVTDASGKILFNCQWGYGGDSGFLVTVNPDGTVYGVVEYQALDSSVLSTCTPAIAPDGTVYINDWDDGLVIAIESEGICTTDKITLGKRHYSLYGNGSVNLSTGNFVMEQTDIAMPSIGPSLHFTRFYNSTNTYEGTQGKGWTHNYNTHLTINTDQSINVAYADGQELQFTYSGSGYDRPAGCFETLEAGPDSTYIVTFKDQTKYTYNSTGQLNSITDKNSNTLTLSYTNGLLITATEPAGRSLTFGYEDNLISGITDSAGRSVSYTYDNGQLETVEDVRDNIIQYQYDEQGLTTIIDPDNITILHNDYDSCSRVISQTDGRGNVTGFSYDPNNRQTTVTDAVYKITTVEYDEKYRSTKVIYPGNITETLVYDDNNCRTDITDGRGNNTHYNYDNFGNLLDITDPARKTTTMTYDSYNNLLTVENALDNQIIFDYDSAGNLETIKDPFDKITSYDYYSNGQLQRITTPSDGDINSGITVYNYYPDGMLQTVTDAVYNITTTFGYDDFGHLQTITDAALKTTTIHCDAAGNINDVTDPMGHTTGYTYDWRGNILTKTNARGIVTKYIYNNVGLLEKKVDAFNILDYETVYGYNALNQLETITDPRGYQTIYSYDDLGRLSGITDPLGHTTGYHYDNAGNLDGIIDAYGIQVLTVDYDSRNNPETIMDALGNTTTNTFTDLNSLYTSKDPMDNITRFDYNDLNILNKTTDALSGQGKQEFDAHGNRKSMEDPNTNTTVFRFDPANRVRNITTAVGGSTDIDYNSRNLISWKRNARGQETNYYYYDNGWLHYFTNPDGTTTYTYDGNGNLLTASDSNGTIEYRYDELNRVREYIDASGNLIGYSYDANSNLKTITYPDAKQVIYDYTPNNHLEKVTDWANRITSYEYDYNGRLKKTTRPDGTVETREYYDNGKLLQLKDIDAGGNIISQYDYTYDDAGNIKDDNNSNEAGPYTLNSAALTYDAGNRLGTYEGQTVNYDADGNMTRGPLAGDMENFTFDARSRLTGAGDTSYTYDAGNKRIRASEGVHQASYVVNPNAPLSQVLTATDEQNNKTYYVYGLGLIGQESAGGSYRSYHFDHLGSTIALTSESGIITDRFQYAPYGELVYRSGSTATPFLFNGQYGVMTDESDLYYMQARYYNPVAKRFLSPDTLIGHISNPQSQNRYTYCQGNPANYIDPTGHIGIMPDGSIYMAEGDTDIDKQLLQMKIEYVKDGSNKAEIAAKAEQLRNDNLEGWHVRADQSLDYFTIPDVTEKLNNIMHSNRGAFEQHSDDILWFKEQFNYNCPFDIKTSPEWQHEHVIYNRAVIRGDAPANIIYGYLGKASQFSDFTLRICAGGAQQFANAGQPKNRSWIFTYFGDAPGDWELIKMGIDVYNSEAKQGLNGAW